MSAGPLDVCVAVSPRGHGTKKKAERGAPRPRRTREKSARASRLSDSTDQAIGQTDPVAPSRPIELPLAIRYHPRVHASADLETLLRARPRDVAAAKQKLRDERADVLARLRA